MSGRSRRREKKTFSTVEPFSMLCSANARIVTHKNSDKDSDEMEEAPLKDLSFTKYRIKLYRQNKDDLFLSHPGYKVDVHLNTVTRYEIATSKRTLHEVEDGEGVQILFMFARDELFDSFITRLIQELQQLRPDLQLNPQPEVQYHPAQPQELQSQSQPQQTQSQQQHHPVQPKLEVQQLQSQPQATTNLVNRKRLPPAPPPKPCSSVAASQSLSPPSPLPDVEQLSDDEELPDANYIYVDPNYRLKKPLPKLPSVSSSSVSSSSSSSLPSSSSEIPQSSPTCGGRQTIYAGLNETSVKNSLILAMSVEALIPQLYSSSIGMTSPRQQEECEDTLPKWQCPACIVKGLGSNAGSNYACVFCDRFRTDAWKCDECEKLHLLCTVECNRCGKWRCTVCSWQNGAPTQKCASCGMTEKR